MVDLESAHRWGWEVSADGRTFYVVELDGKLWKSARIDVVPGWRNELARLVQR